VSFGNYTSQAPKTGKTSPCVLRGLRNADGSHPVVHVEYLGEENRPFYLEQLAKAQTRMRAVMASSTPADMDRQAREDRLDNRETVIQHAARKLENVFHVDGSLATEADISGFIRSIPDRDFDQLFAHAQNHNNYRDYPIVGEPQAIAEK
jgi:hypothetical protein